MLSRIAEGATSASLEAEIKELFRGWQRAQMSDLIVDGFKNDLYINEFAAFVQRFRDALAASIHGSEYVELENMVSQTLVQLERAMDQDEVTGDCTLATAAIADQLFRIASTDQVALALLVPLLKDIWQVEGAIEKAQGVGDTAENRIKVKELNAISGLGRISTTLESVTSTISIPRRRRILQETVLLLEMASFLYEDLRGK